jgi:hypothetical protein
MLIPHIPEKFLKRGLGRNFFQKVPPPIQNWVPAFAGTTHEGTGTTYEGAGTTTLSPSVIPIPPLSFLRKQESRIPVKALLAR